MSNVSRGNLSPTMRVSSRLLRYGVAYIVCRIMPCISALYQLMTCANL